MFVLSLVFYCQAPRCHIAFFHEDFGIAPMHLFPAIGYENVGLGTLFRDPVDLRVVCLFYFSRTSASLHALFFCVDYDLSLRQLDDLMLCCRRWHGVGGNIALNARQKLFGHGATSLDTTRYSSACNRSELGRRQRLLICYLNAPLSVMFPRIAFAFCLILQG